MTPCPLQVGLTGHIESGITGKWSKSKTLTVGPT